MPKLRLTEEQRRERALMLVIARARLDNGLKDEEEAADFLGVPHTSWYRQIKDPYHYWGLAKAAEKLRRLEVTDRELCEIFGVPYHGQGRAETCA